MSLNYKSQCNHWPKGTCWGKKAILHKKWISQVYHKLLCFLGCTLSIKSTPQHSQHLCSETKKCQIFLKSQLREISFRFNLYPQKMWSSTVWMLSDFCPYYSIYNQVVKSWKFSLVFVACLRTQPNSLVLCLRAPCRPHCSGRTYKSIRALLQPLVRIDTQLQDLSVLSTKKNNTGDWSKSKSWTQSEAEL